MKKGDKIRIVRRRLPIWGKCLVGLEGTVYNINQAAVTEWEMKHGAEKKLEVSSTNRGPLMKSSSGKDKAVYAWLPGTICTVYEDEVEIC